MSVTVLPPPVLPPGVFFQRRRRVVAAATRGVEAAHAACQRRCRFVFAQIARLIEAAFFAATPGRRVFFDYFNTLFFADDYARWPLPMIAIIYFRLPAAAFAHLSLRRFRH